jgi:hypothetical protein
VRLAHSRLSLRRSRRHAASLGRDLRIKGRNGIWNIGGTHLVPVRSGGPCGAPRGDKRWRSEWRRTGLPHFRAASRNRRAGRMLPRDLCQSFGGMQQAQRVGGPPSALQGVTNVLLKIFPAFREPRGAFSCAQPTSSGRFSRPNHGRLPFHSRSTRTTESAQVATEFLEDIERLARLSGPAAGQSVDARKITFENSST